MSSAKARSITNSGKANPRVAKPSSTTLAAAKSTATPANSIAPLALVATSRLRKLSASHTSDSSPGKAVLERTRKKTNANEIRDDEWNLVTEKLATVRDLLTHVHVKSEPKSEMEGMMEEYIAQCEKAM